jgi:hypothetical protein
MLRDRRLFPSNLELADFAVRIIPNIPRSRFSKISRPEIAARIIDFIETLTPDIRQNLEESMREAMAADVEKPSDRKSFFQQWERIIKGF